MQKKERHSNRRKREGTNELYIHKDDFWQEIGDGIENISPIKTDINPNYIGYVSDLRATASSPQIGHITLSFTPYRQLENQSTKYHRQQPPV